MGFLKEIYKQLFIQEEILHLHVGEEMKLFHNNSEIFHLTCTKELTYRVDFKGEVSEISYDDILNFLKLKLNSQNLSFSKLHFS